MRNFYYYDKIDSTMNEYLRLKELSSDPICVRAGTQNDGVGRGDHIWLSPYGGLWFTFDIQYAKPTPSFALFTGCCIHSTMQQLFSPLAGKLMIKWTNDLMYDGKKLVGILCRHQPSRNLYTIGIGINTNNDIAPDLGKFGAISLKDILGFEIANDYLCKTLIKAVEDQCQQISNSTSYLAYCNDNLFGKNRQAKLEICGIEMQAEIIGVDPTGALGVRKEMGEYISVHSGSIIELLD